MIPIWLLTVLHYLSLTAAAAVLLLLAWRPGRSLFHAVFGSADASMPGPPRADGEAASDDPNAPPGSTENK